MTLPLLLGCLWVIVAAVVATLKMQRQMAPGIILLITAPALIALIWADYGWKIGLPALLAFVSMFRNPLRYFIGRALGQKVELPPELQERDKK